MHNAQEANAYLRTQVLTAPPEKLRLMLLDGSIRFLHQAIEGLRARDFEASYNGISQARAIVLELATGIREDTDRELAERVRSVYMYLYRELIDASFNRDVARLEKAAELLRYERETWAMLIEKVAAERASGARVSEAPPPGAAEPAREPVAGFQAEG
jgi:flagellar secretion chaperone FliS